MLEIKLGDPVSGHIVGHSALNGAPIPDTATISLASNDPAVATVPVSVPVPSGGAMTIDFDVTVLAVGTTDIHLTVSLADGTVFEDTATLMVDPAPIPGLVRVTLALTSP